MKKKQPEEMSTREGLSAIAIVFIIGIGLFAVCNYVVTEVTREHELKIYHIVMVECKNGECVRYEFTNSR